MPESKFLMFSPPAGCLSVGKQCTLGVDARYLAFHQAHGKSYQCFKGFEIGSLSISVIVETEKVEEKVGETV